LISVDLNNTPYTYVYKKINKNFKDSFVEKGSGFGSTYGFGLIPIRIDYLFVSSSINVDYFKTHDINLSDHKPISVFLNI
jgi:endonuclease/exonuclease/phosphatase family metal-dependent hydrolase